MEAVTAGDEIAFELLVPALVTKPHQRAGRVHAEECHVPDLVPGGRADRGARGHEIVHHPLLAVDPDGAAGQVLEVDPVTAAPEPQLDAMVDEPLPVQPLGQTGCTQQLHGPLFQDARAHALQDVLPALDPRARPIRRPRGGADVPATGPRGRRR